MVMPKGKSKSGTIISPLVLVSGSTIVEVGAEEFIDITVTEYRKIIHTFKKKSFTRSKDLYLYVAPGSVITYFTRIYEKLAEVQVDIFAKRLYITGFVL